MQLSTMMTSILNLPPRIYPNGNEMFEMFFNTAKILDKFDGTEMQIIYYHE
jgi:hypothetical protein